MKICVLAQRIPFPPNKGEKLRTFHQLKFMVEQGHEVRVLSFHESDKDKALARELSDALNIEVQTFAHKAKLLRYIWALLKGQPLSVGAFLSSSMQQQINQILNDKATDVMYLTASSLAYYVRDAAQQLPPPCQFMMDFMDVDSDKWRQYAQNAGFPMSWVYTREEVKIRALEKWVNAHFMQTFLIAQEEVNLFAREVSNSKPVAVLGNGLEFREFYPPAKPPAPEPAEYLFTGVMDYKPNVDAVIWFVQHCWPEIKRALPHARFTIAGMNPVSDIRDLSKDTSIRVTGFVDDILPYFHAATAFVAPFRLARGVQNKVLQAVACQIPVVTTPMGAEGIGFASDATMAIAESATDFTAACIAISKNRAEALVRAEHALDSLKARYSWEQQLVPLNVALENIQ